MPHAAACIAWARPISPPSGVTTELLDMFCALNGATDTPRRASHRQIPATSTLLPESEVVPATSSAPRMARYLREGQDLCPIRRDNEGVLELGGALLVFGGYRPTIRPHIVVNRTERNHRFDGEGHTLLQHGVHGGLVVVQHDQFAVEATPDPMAGEVANDAIAEALGVGLDDPPDDVELPARAHRA